MNFIKWIFTLILFINFLFAKINNDNIIFKVQIATFNKITQLVNFIKNNKDIIQKIDSPFYVIKYKKYIVLYLFIKDKKNLEKIKKLFNNEILVFKKSIIDLPSINNNTEVITILKKNQLNLKKIDFNIIKNNVESLNIPVIKKKLYLYCYSQLSIINNSALKLPFKCLNFVYPVYNNNEIIKFKINNNYIQLFFLQNQNNINNNFINNLFKNKNNKNINLNNKSIKLNDNEVNNTVKNIKNNNMNINNNNSSIIKEKLEFNNSSNNYLKVINYLNKETEEVKKLLKKGEQFNIKNKKLLGIKIDKFFQDKPEYVFDNILNKIFNEKFNKKLNKDKNKSKVKNLNNNVIVKKQNFIDNFKNWINNNINIIINVLILLLLILLFLTNRKKEVNKDINSNNNISNQKVNKDINSNDNISNQEVNNKEKVQNNVKEEKEIDENKKVIEELKKALKKPKIKRKKINKG